MNKHKSIISLMTLSLIVCSLAGCTEYRDVDDNGMFRLEFQEEVIEGKLYHPVSHDYLLTDWFMDNLLEWLWMDTTDSSIDDLKEFYSKEAAVG